MEQILDSVKHLEATSLERGHDVLRQGERKRQLYVLAKGSVEILKNGQRLCEISEPGSVFGELSVLLKTFHFATVRTLEPSSFLALNMIALGWLISLTNPPWRSRRKSVPYFAKRASSQPWIAPHRLTPNQAPSRPIFHVHDDCHPALEHVDRHERQ